MAHPATQHVIDLFSFGPLDQESQDKLNEVRNHFEQFASFLGDLLPDQPEVTVALRYLMDAKNWAGLAIVAEDKRRNSGSSS